MDSKITALEHCPHSEQRQAGTMKHTHSSPAALGRQLQFGQHITQQDFAITMLWCLCLIRQAVAGCPWFEQRQLAINVMPVARTVLL